MAGSGPQVTLAAALPHPDGVVITGRESEFYDRLRAALPEVDIYPQIPIKYLDFELRDKESLCRIPDNKTLDFVVCAKNGAVLYAIELNDRSCAWQFARRDDLLSSDIAQAIGLRVVRYWSVKTSTIVIRRDFEAHSRSALMG